MSWDQLLEIVRELNEPARTGEGVYKHCLVDGNELSINQDGKRGCAFCGWTPDEPTPVVAQYDTTL